MSTQYCTIMQHSRCNVLITVKIALLQFPVVWQESIEQMTLINKTDEKINVSKPLTELETLFISSLLYKRKSVYVGKVAFEVQQSVFVQN